MDHGLSVFILVGIIAIVILLTILVQKPQPEFPEYKYISQSVLVKADADITTVQPVPLSATTCTHDWQVMSEKTLSVEHEQKHIVLLNCRHCGGIDKTVVTTSKVPVSPIEWKRESCKHNWDEEKSVNLKSAFEQLSDAGKSVDFLKKVELEDIPRDFFRKVYLKVRVCKTCGEVHTISASNYETYEGVVN